MIFLRAPLSIHACYFLLYSISYVAAPYHETIQTMDTLWSRIILADFGAETQTHLERYFKTISEDDRLLFLSRLSVILQDKATVGSHAASAVGVSAAAMPYLLQYLRPLESNGSFPTGKWFVLGLITCCHRQMCDRSDSQFMERCVVLLISQLG